MSTTILTFNPPVATSATVLGTPVYDYSAIGSYGAWREICRIGWSNTLIGDKITMHGNVVLSTTSITSSGSNELAIKARMRLFDETTGFETWGGLDEITVLRTFGATVTGVAEAIACFNIRYSVREGSLEPGHAYTVRLEARKEQVAGSPTATVTPRDGAIYGDSASIS